MPPSWRGLFEADGTVTQGSPSWSSSCEAFSRQVKALLLAMGYPTTTKLDVSGWEQSTVYVLRLKNIEAYNDDFREQIGFTAPPASKARFGR